MHDLIEDSEITIKDIESKFGNDVALIVKANTKNEDLHEEERYEELLKRCIETSEAASIVKAADIIDNLITYRRIKSDEGIQNMLNFGAILLGLKPVNYTDKIFNKLKELI